MISGIVVMHHVHDGGIVTISAAGGDGIDERSYELDMRSDGARRLAAWLREAADGADQP